MNTNTTMRILDHMLKNNPTCVKDILEILKEKLSMTTVYEVAYAETDVWISQSTWSSKEAAEKIKKQLQEHDQENAEGYIIREHSVQCTEEPCFIVICKDGHYELDSYDEVYVLATRQRFITKQEALRWAAGISLSREPIVVECPKGLDKPLA